MNVHKTLLQSTASPVKMYKYLFTLEKNVTVYSISHEYKYKSTTLVPVTIE